MNWFVKFWVVAALIPFWGAVIAVLLDRLHDDSKRERPVTQRGNKAQTAKQH